MLSRCILNRNEVLSGLSENSDDHPHSAVLPGFVSKVNVMHVYICMAVSEQYAFFRE